MSQQFYLLLLSSLQCLYSNQFSSEIIPPPLPSFANHYKKSFVIICMLDNFQFPVTSIILTLEYTTSILYPGFPVTSIILTLEYTTSILYPGFPVTSIILTLEYSTSILYPGFPVTSIILTLEYTTSILYPGFPVIRRK